MESQTHRRTCDVKLGWYINRLRSMGTAEIVHRVIEAGRKRRSRGRHEGWERYAPGALPLLPGLREAILSADEPIRRAIAQAADDVVAGRFEALGRTWPEAAVRGFPPSLWRYDPVTGGAWPGAEAYAHDIDFRHDGSRGDVKYVWEINRLQQLMPLAAHVALTGDAGALAATERLIDSWYDANPPYRGVAWASGIEVALRAISLIFAATLVGSRLSDASRHKVGRILSASAFWLERFPSLHSSANNHRIAELSGLYLIGLARGDEPGPARAELIAETLKQILPDGAGAEQTPTYAAFSAEMALLCAFGARHAGCPFPAEFDARLGRFAEFITWLGRPAPAIGDDDEGRVLTLVRHDPDYAGSVAAGIGGYLGVPGAGTRDFRTLVFGAPAGPAPRPAGLRTFADGGLSVWYGQLGGREARLTFDHGPLGYLSIAAHGHADALSLTLSLDGEPVLVDPGTWLYGSGGEWRSWFRSTPAHNTLNLAGASQSIMSGPFNWSGKAVARLVESSDGPLLRAIHDGYQRRFDRLVQRTLAIDSSGIAMRDQLLGGPPHPAELVFQLAPGLTVTRNGGSLTVSRDRTALIRLELPAGSVAMATGEDRPDGGWVSPRFGQKCPATRITWSGAVGEAGVTTRIVVLAPTGIDTHPTQT
jgi:hypothetical protein